MKFYFIFINTMFHFFDKTAFTMDETIYIILKLPIDFAVEVWFSIAYQINWGPILGYKYSYTCLYLVHKFYRDV